MHERRRNGHLPAPDREGSRVPRSPADFPPVRTAQDQSSIVPLGNDDSKHINAAALALNLATNSSWSDIPLASARTTHEGMYPSATDLPDSRTNTLIPDTDLGPPPAYSSCEHSSSDTSPDRMRSPAMRGVTSPANMEHEVEESDERNNPEDLLIGAPNEKAPQGWTPWMRENITARRQQRWHIYAAMLLIIIIALGCVLGYRTSHRTPRHRYLPLISSEKVYTQHETYEDIRGRFELYERLDLSTTTGSIDIEIDPQNGNDTAELILSSSTGDIKLGISESYWMRRERTTRAIRTEIKTVQGNIYGRILLGNGGYSSVDSVTGKQDLRVYVYNVGADDQVSQLMTTSHIGDQIVAIVNFGGWEAPISSLKAEHCSLGTANIDLQYSHAWRGIVHAVSSMVGHLTVQRDGYLEFDKEEKNEMIAHKGDVSDAQTIDVIVKGTGSAEFKSWYTW